MLGSKHKPVRTTQFSEFIRTASSREKKRVYQDVLERASERQKHVAALAKEKGVGTESSKGNPEYLQSAHGEAS